MTRHEFLWAIVKGLGIYFLIYGLLGVVQVLIQIIGTSDMGPGTYWESPAKWMVLVNNLLQVGIGAYMLLDGSWLIGLANRKRTRPETDAPIPEGESPKTA